MSPAVIATEDAAGGPLARLQIIADCSASQPTTQFDCVLAVIKFRRIVRVVARHLDERYRHTDPVHADVTETKMWQKQKEPRRKASEKKTERAEAISLDRFITLGLSKAL
jgi:hypothetical protein